MRTHLLNETETRAPWLERAARSGAPAERIELARLPFTIGRNAACDLPIPSAKVSREHATIQREGRGFRLRDLGSTNGTYVNGQKVTDARLADGDIVLIADIEFCFYCGADDTLRKTVTQVLEGCGPSDDELAGLDLVRELRAWHEELLCRGARIRFEAIVDLESGQPVGYEARRRPPVAGLEPPAEVRQLKAVECRLAERELQLERMLAVEQACFLPAESLVFLRLEPAEVGADDLPDALARLQETLSGNRRLVAQIPDSAVADIPFFRNFIAQLRERSVQVAYEGFAGGPQQALAQQEFAPQFLKLASALVRGVDRSSDRQRQIQQIVAAVERLGARVIAAGVHTENEAAACRRLGCRLAQGEHYAAPPALEWPPAGAARGLSASGTSA